MQTACLSGKRKQKFSPKSYVTKHYFPAICARRRPFHQTDDSIGYLRMGDKTALLIGQINEFL